MWSPVRKAIGVGADGYLGEWHAFRQYATAVDGAAAHDLFVWFDADLLPGYAWSFPLPDGRANIGFGVLRDGTRRIQDMKAHLGGPARPAAHPRRARPGCPSSRAATRRGRSRPASTRPRSLVGRVLLVGDAAMATDVMTGEGIGQALLTGRLAAEAILAGGALDPGRRRRRLSGRACATTSSPTTGCRCASAACSPIAAARVARSAILDHAGGWSRRNFARWMFEDEPRAVALTPSRWHRRVLARPGPFA